ncbi:DUF5060 domain-containing protein [Paludisphaera soli]|uniref:DUF5060 domain-containing protein n=1 Tax=Paludisphaera soli TaxID=2712865 RepID=UPI0013EA9015|nr:DUF5060 domain-containing protein [Paludisphaera soli]
MKTASWTAVLVCLAVAPARAQLAVEADARGVVEARVGGTAYLSDLAVSVVKPGWSGDLANQRAVDPSTVKVHREGATTTYTMPLAGGPLSGLLIERITRENDGVTLEFEVIPDREAELEAVLLRGSLATAEHAGKTAYLVAEPDGPRGVLPASLDADRYVVWSGDPDWLGLERPGSGGLRLTPRDVRFQLQDDRKWDASHFSLLMTASGGEVLARKPIRFGLALRAEAPGALAKAAAPAAAPAGKDDRPLAIVDPRLDRDRVDVFATVALDADVHARYENPFDPDQVAVDAEVRSPDGRKVSVPGYYHVPFRVETKGRAEILTVDGAPGFRVRYAPTVAGKHEVVLKVRDATGDVRSAPLTFVAEASKSPGFVRVAKEAPGYFAFDDGSSYFAIGENVCWANGRSPLASFKAWFESLGKAGGNWARLWLAFNEKGLEWSPSPTPKPGTGSYQGLGRYAMDNAWRLDEVLRIAEANGIRLMYCIGTYGEFKDGGFFNEGSWVSNPYNARNGGPCARPEDFWTDAAARKLYKQRLRYLVARWGHSPFVFAWEFWNEVEPGPGVAAWTSEMAAYLKSIDPNRRLVSTSYGSPPIWNDPNVDFTMTHMYGQAGETLDFTDRIKRETWANLEFGKPYLLAEFGIDWQAGDEKWDPEGRGLNMHNGAWASIASGAAGTSMLWWWDGYVHPRNVYHVLTPIKAFADAIDWANSPMKPIARIAVEAAADEAESFTDVTVRSSQGWGRTASNRHELRRDGTVEGGPMATTLGSPTRGGNGKELFSEVAWTLDMPRGGEVLVRIGEVCTAARLRVAVDGREVLDRALPTGEPGQGPWKSSRLLEPYKVWVADYDRGTWLPGL